METDSKNMNKNAMVIMYLFIVKKLHYSIICLFLLVQATHYQTITCENNFRYFRHVLTTVAYAGGISTETCCSACSVMYNTIQTCSQPRTQGLPARFSRHVLSSV